MPPSAVTSILQRPHSPARSPPACSLPYSHSSPPQPGHSDLPMSSFPSEGVRLRQTLYEVYLHAFLLLMCLLCWKNFPVFSSRFFGWSNNQNHVRQINRRTTILVSYIQKHQKNKTQRQSGNWVLSAALSYRTRGGPGHWRGGGQSTEGREQWWSGGSLSSTCVLHIRVNSVNGSLSGTGPIYNILGIKLLSLLGLHCLEIKIIHRPTWPIWRWPPLLPSSPTSI